MREVAHVFQAGVGEVAAGQLSRALEQVADHRAAGEQRRFVERPSEGMDHRCQEQRRVGDPAGDDDVGTGGDRRQDGIDAQIGIGGDRRPEFAHWLPGLERRRVRVEPVEHVVTGDHRHLQRQPEFGCDLDHLAAGANRVGCAQVADQPAAAALEQRQQRGHACMQQRVVALVGIGQPAQLRGGDGAFGQAFEHQPVEPALRGEHHGRVDPVALETRAAADADRLMARHGQTSIAWAGLSVAPGPQSIEQRGDGAEPSLWDNRA